MPPHPDASSPLVSATTLLRHYRAKVSKGGASPMDWRWHKLLKPLFMGGGRREAKMIPRDEAGPQKGNRSPADRPYSSR